MNYIEKMIIYIYISCELAEDGPFTTKPETVPLITFG